MHDTRLCQRRTLTKYLSLKIQKNNQVVGCVSINFDLEQVKVDESKIFAIEL